MRDRIDASFESLNDGQRQILRLLAQGHTAKSIATTLNLSVGAVNERLREARRRTGAASSRDLARDLHAQENRDEQIGMAKVPVVRASIVAPAPIGVSMIRKVMIAMGSMMMAGGLVTAAMLAQGTDAAPPPVVVATSPRDGATIAPGPFVLTVTFDRAMRADGYSFTTIDAAAFPRCEAAVAMLPDGRGFAMRCVAVAGAHYGVGFNHGRFRNFRGHDGVPAKGRVIRFSVR